MLLSSEDSIHKELDILLSSGPSTSLNSNKLFMFSIIMMRKAVGAGKCAFQMIFFFAAISCTPPKTSRPALLANWRHFLHRC